ncbi:hypothetical protein HMPREF3201_02227 [Megasphaera sp. MJR8396C]|nr:hypothetical protein HMPREF3201_02227 [Megasphaera sp. MJR8396C]
MNLIFPKIHDFFYAKQCNYNQAKTSPSLSHRQGGRSFLSYETGRKVKNCHRKPVAEIR